MATNILSDQTDASSTNQTKKVETLDAKAPRFKCRVLTVATVDVAKSIRVDQQDGNIYESDGFGRPDWESLSVAYHFCTECEEEFEDKEKAKSHLKNRYNRWQAKYQLPGIPESTTEHISGSMTFNEEPAERTIDSIPVVAAENEENTAALIKEGVGALIGTSRRSYSIPANFDFTEWEPLNGGKLTHPSGTNRIQKELLKRAIDYLATPYNHPYNPSNFTLYDRGDAAFLLVANGEAIAIAPITNERSS